MTGTPSGLEVLEQRRLLSVPFASVGLGWAFGAGGAFDIDVVSTEGTLAGDLTVGGSLYREDEADRDRRDDLWYDSVIRLEGGRLDRDPPEGFLGDPEERNGAWFVSGDGYPVGWWLSEYQGGAVEDAELLVTLDEDVALADYSGTYQYSTIAFDVADGETFLSNGRMIVDEDEVRWTATRGTAHRLASNVDFLDPFGGLVTSRNEYLYLSADGSTIVFADMAKADGVTAIGVATRPATIVESDSLVGVYLTLYATGAGGTLNFRQLAIDLEADGDYKIYDLDEYDGGARDPLERGSWRVSGDRVVLEQSNSDGERSFVIGENGSTLLATEIDTGPTELPLFALGVKVVPEPEPQDVVFNVPGKDEFDRPQIYQLETDDVWYVVDVISTIGGPVPVGEVVSWVDPKDGLSYGAAVTSQGLILYTEGEDDSWSYRNLTAEVFGGVAPTGELEVMVAPNGAVHLTALAGDGDLLHYVQNGAQDDSGQWRWSFENISEEDLRPAGVATPDFSGLVSYATAWGGLNVVGLDADGELWGVWTAPGLARWQVSNLTSVYGSAPLVGGLTVYLTPWNGINIAGVGRQGHLLVTWWVPSFKGQWAQSDLTAATGGPLYVPETLGSFVSSWGGLNIVGADSATGEVVVTWWAPARQDEGWALASLSEVVPSGSPVISSPFTGIAAPDSSLNVFGYAGGDFIRYYWEPGFGGSWAVQNLTDVAVRR